MIRSWWTCFSFAGWTSCTGWNNWTKPGQVAHAKKGEQEPSVLCSSWLPAKTSWSAQQLSTLQQGITIPAVVITTRNNTSHLFMLCKGTEGKIENKKLIFSGPSQSQRPKSVYGKTLSLLSFTFFSSLLITFDRHIKLYSPGTFDRMIVLINRRWCIYYHSMYLAML